MTLNARKNHVVQIDQTKMRLAFQTAIILYLVAVNDPTGVGDQDRLGQCEGKFNGQDVTFTIVGFRPAYSCLLIGSEVDVMFGWQDGPDESGSLKLTVMDDEESYFFSIIPGTIELDQ